ncbi:MAG TPA: YbhB/YbcL family Raf kinase inhibitor-like protein [Terriglobia bacterium]|nr:YbhB/YbcL family Raf kinase inhibitor-like protein [Terriglobia bacterium]
MSFALRSSAFHENQSIPAKYTCDGANVSIPLMWTDPPDGTDGFALVMDDPDAPSGTWVHWVVFDLPADIRQLAEARAGNHHMEEVRL